MEWLFSLPTATRSVCLEGNGSPLFVWLVWLPLWIYLCDIWKGCGSFSEEFFCELVLLAWWCPMLYFNIHILMMLLLMFFLVSLEVLWARWFSKIILKTQMILLLLVVEFILFTAVFIFSLDTRSSFEVETSPMEVESSPFVGEVCLKVEGFILHLPLRWSPLLFRWSVDLQVSLGYSCKDELSLLSYRGGECN